MEENFKIIKYRCPYCEHVGISRKIISQCPTCHRKFIGKKIIIIKEVEV